MDIELSGDLDEQGMLFDFGHVKHVLRNTAEDYIDHKLVVPDSLPGLIVEHTEDLIYLSYETPSGEKIEACAPAEAIAVLPLTEETTTEAMEELLSIQLASVVPENVKSIKISLQEESIKGAYYHYSHGLKKHEGNCQRIAHGHRSRLEIYTDGQRSQLTEYQWAKKWKDIYIGSRDDLKASEYHNNILHTRFHYSAAQGEFDLLLPSSSVYLIETESTVEWIAEHIATKLKQQRPQNTFKVYCYEGVNKGAIAER
jgi:6-pyruvoyl-tetrahydropterin synthase